MTESLYQRWERKNWQQRWYLGMEPEDLGPQPFTPHGCGVLPRIFAWFVDSLLMGLVTLMFMASLLMAGWVAFPHTNRGVLIWAIGIILVIMTVKNAYFPLLQSNNGQTIGQTVLGIKIVDAQGNPPSLRQALRRRSAQILSVITLGLGYFWMLVDPNQQTFHDKLAGTYVVMA